MHLRILATSDLHAHILPYDYAEGRPQPGEGLAALATVIAQERAAAETCLLVDNGDTLQGTPLAETPYGHPDVPAHEAGTGKARDVVHPVVAAMNAVGYDAAGLGNHDLNYGLDALARAMEGAEFPVLGANLISDGPGPHEPLFPAELILVRALHDSVGRAHWLRIGLFSVMPPQAAIWDRDQLQGRATVTDAVEAAARATAALRAAGADLVIALAHTGIGPCPAEPGMENAARPIAGIDGIDALVLGHTHRCFPGPDHPADRGLDPVAGRIAGKPAVMPGHHGSHLGVIDLALEHDATGGWGVSDSHVRLSAVSPLTSAAPAVVRAVETSDRSTRVRMEKPLGRLKSALSTHFTFVGVDPATALVASAQAHHVRQSLPEALDGGLPLLSSVAPFRAGGAGGPDNYVDIPAGTLRHRHIEALYPYPNTLCVAQVTGAVVADWLERAATAFRTVAPGAEDAPLRNHEVPAYNFEILHGTGLRYQIDLSQPPGFDIQGRPVPGGGKRIAGITIDGRALGPEDPAVLVTNTYRAGIGLAQASHVVLGGRQPRVTDILRDYIAEHGDSWAPPPPSWCFAPVPGTTALMRTGAGAVAHMGAVSELPLTGIGPDEAGYLRFRLAL